MNILKLFQQTIVGIFVGMLLHSIFFKSVLHFLYRDGSAVSYHQAEMVIGALLIVLAVLVHKEISLGFLIIGGYYIAFGAVPSFKISHTLINYSIYIVAIGIPVIAWLRSHRNVLTKNNIQSLLVNKTDLIRDIIIFIVLMYVPHLIKLSKLDVLLPVVPNVVVMWLGSLLALYVASMMQRPLIKAGFYVIAISLFFQVHVPHVYTNLLMEAIVLLYVLYVIYQESKRA